MDEHERADYSAELADRVLSEIEHNLTQRDEVRLRDRPLPTRVRCGNYDGTTWKRHRRTRWRRFRSGIILPSEIRR